MRRLYALIYVAFVTIGLGSLLVSTLLAAALWEPPGLRVTDAPAAVRAIEHLPPHQLQAHLDVFHDDTDVSVTIWERGRVVASAGDPMPRGRPGWWRHGRIRGVRVRMADGRMLAAGQRFRPFRHATGLTWLLAVAGLMALGSYPLARRITRRLELVEQGVQRWGAGDLAARVPVHGQDEIAAVAKSFNAAAQRVEQLFEAQRRVLASASHELRSPLARLRMAIELARDGLAQPGWSDQAIRDVEELDATVGDLLAVGRMQATDGPDHPEPVAMHELVAEEAAHVGAGVRGPALVVHGDPRLLRRLVRNLLENAVRHGSAPVEVELHADGLSVHDRGPGVPESVREQIFEPFYRPAGHDEGRDGGVGLGLHLVREIARYHGGTVTYVPREGGGSTFRVHFR